MKSNGGSAAGAILAESEGATFIEPDGNCERAPGTGAGSGVLFSKKRVQMGLEKLELLNALRGRNQSSLE